ncbi:hypothetical protein [Candidatus Poriferisodalis sp.]|uniref:hypothetical protein n=1 Tax=Candidatus Poriferisodalis sp. TaxID=3101277 RepID=UPI003B014AB5
MSATLATGPVVRAFRRRGSAASTASQGDAFDVSACESQITCWFRRGAGRGQCGSISLELLLVTPVLMLLVSLVLWAGAAARAQLTSELAAEEGAAAAQACAASGEARIESGEAVESDVREECGQVVAEMLDARPGLRDLCIGGPQINDDVALDIRDGGSSTVRTLAVEHRCETDGGVGSFFGLFPTMSVSGRGSEVYVARSDAATLDCQEHLRVIEENIKEFEYQRDHGGLTDQQALLRLEGEIDTLRDLRVSVTSECAIPSPLQPTPVQTPVTSPIPCNKQNLPSDEQSPFIGATEAVEFVSVDVFERRVQRVYGDHLPGGYEDREELRKGDPYDLFGYPDLPPGVVIDQARHDALYNAGRKATDIFILENQGLAFNMHLDRMPCGSGWTLLLTTQPALIGGRYVESDIMKQGKIKDDDGFEIDSFGGGISHSCTTGNCVTQATDIFGLLLPNSVVPSESIVAPDPIVTPDLDSIVRFQVSVGYRPNVPDGVLCEGPGTTTNLACGGPDSTFNIHIIPSHWSDQWKDGDETIDPFGPCHDTVDRQSFFEEGDNSVGRFSTERGTYPVVSSTEWLPCYGTYFARAFANSSTMDVGSDDCSGSKDVSFSARLYTAPSQAAVTICPDGRVEPDEEFLVCFWVSDYSLPDDLDLEEFPPDACKLFVVEDDDELDTISPIVAQHACKKDGDYRLHIQSTPAEIAEGNREGNRIASGDVRFHLVKSIDLSPLPCDTVVEVVVDPDGTSVTLPSPGNPRTDLALITPAVDADLGFEHPEKDTERGNIGRYVQFCDTREFSPMRHCGDVPINEDVPVNLVDDDDLVDDDCPAYRPADLPWHHTVNPCTSEFFYVMVSVVNNDDVPDLDVEELELVFRIAEMPPPALHLSDDDLAALRNVGLYAGRELGRMTLTIRND